MTKIIFHNPFKDIIEAAKKIYPDLEVEIDFDYIIGNKKPPYGVTTFPDNENIQSIPQILISPYLSLKDSLEILMHELAHVITGSEYDHNALWEEILEKINDEYHKIIKSKIKIF